ncbi:MAG TPA: right-handed parallel beta-helix repeat-containing protein [Armatimonadota bacterium]|jgi:hypothetical protein
MRWRTLVLSAALIALPTLAHAAIIYVNSAAAGDIHDGISWQSAFIAVQPALDSAKPGDEVWVAGGAYAEQLAVQTKDVRLYGGFIGNETSTGQRDGKIHTTIRATSRFSPTIGLYGSTNAILDGFHISGGSPGVYVGSGNVTISNNLIDGNGADGSDYGGIQCAGSATITGNVIQDNQAKSGAGIYVGYSAFALITHNTITDNVAGGYVHSGNGGGIAVSNGSAVIKDNLIVHNASVCYTTYYPDMSVAVGGGVYVWSGFVTLANNTIADNLCTSQGRSEGAGLYALGSVLVANNIFHNNTAAPIGSLATAKGGAISIGDPYSGQSPNNIQVRCNLFHNNAPDDGAPVGVNGNLHADPLYRYTTNGYTWDYHLQPGSPAIDAGDNAFVQPGDTDFDAQPRLLGPAVDIGSYESPATTGLPTLSRVYVRVDGDDRNDGSAWLSAKRSIGAAVSVAAPGAAVWVAQGTYPERVTLKAGIALLGGFAGTETVNYVDRVILPTTIDAGFRGTAVTIPVGATETKVDGFIITRGGGTYGFGGAPNGGAVRCLGDKATLTRNVISGNHLIVSEEDSSSALGAGIYVESVSATIANNIIRDNTVAAYTYTTYPYFWAASVAQGGGIAAISGNLIIANNLISGNEAIAGGNVNLLLAQGAGIYCNGCLGLITNNTIAGNTHHPDGSNPILGGINGTVYLYRSLNTLQLANNIIALNQGGLSRDEDAATFSHNDVFGNGADFGPEGPLTGTNITVDPLIANPGAGDYRLQLLSPCIDAGDLSAVRGETDLAGLPRVLNYAVDLGAYESAYLNSYTVADAASALRVAAGLNAPSERLFSRLSVFGANGHVGLSIAVRLLRKALGTDANP